MDDQAQQGGPDGGMGGGQMSGGGDFGGGLDALGSPGEMKLVILVEKKVQYQQVIWVLMLVHLLEVKRQVKKVQIQEAHQWNHVI